MINFLLKIVNGSHCTNLIWRIKPLLLLVPTDKSKNRNHKQQNIIRYWFCSKNRTHFDPLILNTNGIYWLLSSYT